MVRMHLVCYVCKHMFTRMYGVLLVYVLVHVFT